jgi:hypothetical protein
VSLECARRFRQFRDRGGEVTPRLLQPHTHFEDGRAVAGNGRGSRRRAGRRSNAGTSTFGK